MADPIRSRLLLALERHELTVSELCQILQLPQSTVSRHLKVLGDEGWVASRAEGATHRYRMPLAELEPATRKLWQLVRDEVASSPTAARDGERVESVLAARHTRSQEFFATSAGQWDKLRGELFGPRTELVGLLGLLDPSWVAGDLGCGTGHLSAALAPFVRRVVAIDESAAMLRAARARLNGTGNVELRRGTLETLPIEDHSLDVAFIVLVLHYVSEPERAFREAARVLHPGGRILLVDMLPHDRAEYRQTMGHLWQGFSREQFEGWAQGAGLGEPRFLPLRPDPGVKGPALFVGTAIRNEA